MAPGRRGTGRFDAARALRRPAPLLFATLLTCMAAPRPAMALRVVDWNILNYPAASGALREDDHRAVVAQLDPDVLFVQEVSGNTTAGAQQFLTNVLDVVFPGEFLLATWYDGPDTQNACFYRASVVSMQGSISLTTTLRRIDGWTFRPTGYLAAAAEFRVYSFHLKAGATSADEADRLAECTILRTHLNGLPAGTNFMAGGDFNIRSSTEAAYQQLVGSQADNDGRLLDPISQPGTWYNNIAFAAIHTQSPRTVSLGDGGATGGMDDRFDQILACDDVLDGEGLAYLPGTYTVYGNDGQHFNADLNALPTNSAVGQALADNLRAASDHLPVFLDLQLPAIMVASGDLSFGGVLVGTTAQRTLTVQNTATPPGDDLDYSIAVGPGFTGAVSASVPAGDSQLRSITMDTGSAGVRAATVAVTGDAPDNAGDTFDATGTVYDHAVPSTVAGSQVLAGDVDFGSHAAGSFTDQVVQAHNVGYDALQAQLDVHAAQMSGPDAARFGVVGFAPAQVGTTPASFAVHFDDAGATENTTYTATLTFSTRDQQNLAGAAVLSALSFALEAFVQTTSAAVPPTAIARTTLHPNVPNPFNPATTLSFDLAQSGRARLDVYDPRGRRLATLIDGDLPAGQHQLVWTARAQDGSPLASGVYLVRLVAGDVRQTQRVTLVR
jgi:endonuclease/exonuclease/phosphatase family metal-dependent hydrolase